MACRPADFSGAVLGTAIGGTWAQPLILLARPILRNGNTAERCTRTIIRLPIEAGVARPAG